MFRVLNSGEPLPFLWQAWPLLATDTIERPFPSNKDVSVSNCRRCIDGFAHGVCPNYLVLRPRLYHERISVFTRHQDFSIEGNGRCSEGRGYGHSATFIFYFPSLRIK